jgi:hypothetical protein
VTPIQVVAVCLRLLAVAWFLFGLNHAHGAFAYLGGGSGLAISMPAVWILAIAQLSACAILWFFPVSIASKLLPSYSRPPEPGNPIRLEEWQTLGVICIGLWGLCRAIPDAIYWSTFLNVSFSGDAGVSALGPDHKAGIVATGAEILISTWLLLGARGFAALLFRIRTAGVAK